MAESGIPIGEVGGWLAGALAVVVAVGHGLRWLAGFSDRRSTRREQQIDANEKDYRERIEARLLEMEERDRQRYRESSALRLAFELVAGALRSTDPANIALRQAEQILTAAFPLDPIIPPSMAVQLGAIDRALGAMVK